LNIYLIRHGDAEKSSEKKDFDRELTPHGKTVTHDAVLYWKRLIKSLDYIITSPYKRAFQTAEIMAAAFGLKNEIITDKKLSPGSRVDDIIEIVKSYNSNNIALVGHQPDMGEHISSLISASEVMVEFKKSSIAKISFGNRVRHGKGNLEFLIPAEIFIK